MNLYEYLLYHINTYEHMYMCSSSYSFTLKLIFKQLGKFLLRDIDMITS